jgi:hypothetical protein
MGSATALLKPGQLATPAAFKSLGVAAIQAGVASVTRGLDRLIEKHGEPIGVPRAWFAGAQHRLAAMLVELVREEVGPGRVTR